MNEEVANHLILGLIVGFIPSVSMLGASLVGFQLNVSPLLEATAQNFCAGLIIGAVAKELFPQISDVTAGKSNFFSVSCGFIFGLVFFHFLDYFISFMQSILESCVDVKVEETIENTVNEATPLKLSSSAPYLPGGYQNYTHFQASPAVGSPGLQGFSSNTPPNIPLLFDIPREDMESDKQQFSFVSNNFIIPTKTQSNRQSNTSFHHNHSQLTPPGTTSMHMMLKDEENHRQHDEHDHEDDDNETKSIQSHNSIGYNDDQTVLLLTSHAFTSSEHRKRVINHIHHLLSTVQRMQDQSNRLMASQYNDRMSSSIQIEEICDEIDQNIHRLQYDVDHCRRLMQGAVAGLEGIIPRIWITARGKQALQTRLTELQSHLETMLHTVNEDLLLPGGGIEPPTPGIITTATGPMTTTTTPRTPRTPRANSISHNNNLNGTINHLLPAPQHAQMISIYEALDNMDQVIHSLHHVVEGYHFKWCNRHHRHHNKSKYAEIPSTGSTIPWSFVIPVVLDGMIDGLLLGTTLSLSKKAGMILSLANMIEMGFLGLAVSLRIAKCTASSLTLRYLVLILTPLIMWSMSILGAYAGYQSAQYPALYEGFIAFGIVALLYLVVNELLLEANDLQQGKESWWSGLIVFVGIYTVLLLDAILPA